MITKKVKITNPTGLHMRPAGIFCNKASEFECSVRFRYDNTMANAKSVLSVLGACIKSGDEIVLECEGSDEKEAMEAMVKAIEAAGLPVVHMCTVTPISMTVGANRIVPTIAIPHPLGNPALEKDEEYALRKGLVEKALKALTTEVDGQTIFDN